MWGGFLAVAVIAALWEFLVMTGMHLVIIMFMRNEMMTTGMGTGICTNGTDATLAAFGLALGTFLRLRSKKETSTHLGFLISGIFGGVTEPILYGTCFQYRRTFLTLMIGASVGGACGGITRATVSMMTSSNLLMVLGYTGDSMASRINGVVACVLSLVVSAAATYMIGLSREEVAGEA